MPPTLKLKCLEKTKKLKNLKVNGFVFCHAPAHTCSGLLQITFENSHLEQFVSRVVRYNELSRHSKRLQ